MTGIAGGDCDAAFPMDLFPSSCRYGTWSHDDFGLPCFDGRFTGPAAIERPFFHGFSSGRLNALIGRNGLLRLFTTEGGYTELTASTFHGRGGPYLEWVSARGERHTLAHGDLPPGGGVRYGVGYARFTNVWRDEEGSALEITQEFFSAPDGAPRVGARFTLRNAGSGSLDGRLRIRTDVEPGGKPGPAPRALESGPGRVVWKKFHPGLGDFWVGADPDFGEGRSEGVSLLLDAPLALAPGEARVVRAQAGYGAESPGRHGEPEEAGRAWAARLAGLRPEAPVKWMRDEAIWCAGQLYSYEAYDSSVGGRYLNLGGYGWPLFGVREVPQTALTVAAHDPGLALDCLRWTAKVQYASGDIPHCHAFRRPEAGETLFTGHKESDNEIWFVLGCAEVLHETGRTEFLDEELAFWEGETASVWEHLRRAVEWVRRGIGTGAHGLVRMAEGDWNDYLSGVGARGRGESMMNTGMMCRALARLLPFARERDAAFADECEAWLGELRAAAERGFDGRWFVRGYTDDGAAFGSSEDGRVFLNAQTWCALGGCGTPEMRETAMDSALEACASPIGLTLMSRPYPCPPPPEVSKCPIPRGDGENAGIWPQTVHWAVWALAELGRREEALDLWRRMSLRNHAWLHPDAPFGIFNGPDCYSSAFAGEREGWTQVAMMERAKFPPMNPIVAWPAFSLRQAMGAGLAAATRG